MYGPANIDRRPWHVIEHPKANFPPESNLGFFVGVDNTGKTLRASKHGPGRLLVSKFTPNSS